MLQTTGAQLGPAEEGRGQKRPDFHHQIWSKHLKISELNLHRRHEPGPVVRHAG